ncbi:hypothetical protein [Rhodoferax sp.]|uniref:hypothetical protein n=1 Tax=Rhodoferax sp. TaxID=50421 RepID=UPI0025D3814B|nr:hypothetical protein [Rhodoferax sp.]
MKSNSKKNRVADLEAQHDPEGIYRSVEAKHAAEIGRVRLDSLTKGTQELALLRGATEPNDPFELLDHLKNHPPSVESIWILLMGTQLDSSFFKKIANKRHKLSKALKESALADFHGSTLSKNNVAIRFHEALPPLSPESPKTKIVSKKTVRNWLAGVERLKR